MSVFALPVRASDPFYRFATRLADRTYLFDFEWNEQSQTWSVSMTHESGDPIFAGMTLALGANLLRYPKSEFHPAGQLVALRGDGLDADPGFDDLGETVRLIYFPSDEIPEDESDI